MSFLLDLLGQQIGGDAIKQMSDQIGADADTTQRAVTAALPVMIGGLARNATASQDGAQSLASALDRDHDGSLLDNLGGLLGGSGGLGALLGGGGSASGGLGSLLGAAGQLLGGGGGQTAPKTMDGAGILQHILGNRRGAVEQGISQASGLDVGKVGKLLLGLAPIVMGALGKLKQQRSLDAAGLAGLLDQERTDVERKASGTGSLLSILDADDDGQIIDDVAKLGKALGGSGLLGSLLGGR